MTRVGPIFKKKLIFKIQSKSRILGLKVSNFASIMKLSHAIFIPWISINHKKLHQPHCSKSSFFGQKFNIDFPRKIVEFFWVKSRENAAVLDFLAIDNFDFTRKIVNRVLGEKLVKMMRFCTF